MKAITKKPYVYWECIVNGHNKFWSAQLFEDNGKYILIRKWGAIGTKGQQIELEFSDINQAERELDKLIWDKEKKNYKGIW